MARSSTGYHWSSGQGGRRYEQWEADHEHGDG